MDHKEETKALLNISLCDGVGSKITYALMETFGSAREALDAARTGSDALDALPSNARKGLREGPPRGAVEEEIDLMKEHGVRLVPYFSEDYPAPLQELGPARPPLLWIKGNYTENDRLSVAVVGSRRCTHYGRKQSARLSTDLATRGYTVISGLARGIDGEAHRAAVRTGGRTLAVLGCGLATIYPEEHMELAMKVSSQGALISELPMKTPVRAGNFPPRNRLLSGLSLGVLVIEAAKRSGTLITARWAGEQGKPVMAVPGNVDRPSSRGCHALIRDGATLVEDADDITEAIESISSDIDRSEQQTSSAQVSPPAEETSERQQMRLDALEDRERELFEMLGDTPRHIDSIVEETGLEVGEVSSTLLSLEIKGLATQLDGGRYVRN